MYITAFSAHQVTAPPRGPGEHHHTPPVDLRGVVVLAVEGDVDLYSGPDLRQALTDLLVPLHEAAGRAKRSTTSRPTAGQGGPPAGEWAVVVDLTEVEFIDSYALGVLVQGHHLARRSGRAYALVATHPMIHKLFEITGLARVLPLHPEVLSAVVGLRVARATDSAVTTPVAVAGDVPG